MKKLQAAEEENLKPLAVKYRLEQFNAEAKKLQESFRKIVVHAAVDADVTEEQRQWLIQPDRSFRLS